MTDPIPASEIEAIRANNKRDLDMYDGDLKPVPRQITECATLLRALDALAEENARFWADAMRYNYLRERDLDTLQKGGVFAGMTPKNVVLNGANLDHEVDAAIALDALKEPGQ
jgi:hypothetical protein